MDRLVGFYYEYELHMNDYIGRFVSSHQTHLCKLRDAQVLTVHYVFAIDCKHLRYMFEITAANVFM